MERCSARPQTLVVPHEEATRKGGCQHVEGTSDVRLIAEARTMVGRRHRPVVGRQRRGLRGQVAKVIEGDADGPYCIDIDRGSESRSVRRRVRVAWWPRFDLEPGRRAIQG